MRFLPALHMYGYLAGPAWCRELGVLLNRYDFFCIDGHYKAPPSE